MTIHWNMWHFWNRDQKISVNGCLPFWLKVLWIGVIDQQTFVVFLFHFPPNAIYMFQFLSSGKFVQAGAILLFIFCLCAALFWHLLLVDAACSSNGFSLSVLVLVPCLFFLRWFDRLARLLHSCVLTFRMRQLLCWLHIQLSKVTATFDKESIWLI